VRARLQLEIAQLLGDFAFKPGLYLLYSHNFLPGLDAQFLDRIQIDGINQLAGQKKRRKRPAPGPKKGVRTLSDLACEMEWDAEKKGK
jgi:hypothetical protein